jgi:threonine/homoserine/homoserine lactone efflux protein
MIDLVAFFPGFVAAYAILFVAASSPGPAVALLMGISLTQGRSPALIASAGVAMGSVVINIAMLAGIGLLLEQAAWAMSILRFIGAAYLALLAYGAFRKALNPPKLEAIEMPRQSASRLFLMGLLLQITNPKAIIFWLAIASISATSGGGIVVVGLFVIGAFLISFGCHSAWALVMSAQTARQTYFRARPAIEGVLGTFFSYAAFRLATERS